jgi:hypothetical protein
MRALLFMLLALSLSACSRPLQKADIIGTYTLDNKSVEYTLELRSDGTYVHSSTGEDGEKVTKTGQWEWEDKEDYNKVCLDNFEILPGEDIGEPSGPGFFFLSPERSWRGIRFPIGDPDSPSHYFIKQMQK